jgi:hypothetical protein
VSRLQEQTRVGDLLWVVLTQVPAFTAGLGLKFPRREKQARSRQGISIHIRNFALIVQEKGRKGAEKKKIMHKLFFSVSQSYNTF